MRLFRTVSWFIYSSKRGDAATQQTVDPRSGETLALGWQVFVATKLFWPRVRHGRGSDSGPIEVMP
jgi:hypothetical protein